MESVKSHGPSKVDTLAITHVTTYTMDVTVHQLCISRDSQLLAAIGIKTSRKVC